MGNNLSLHKALRGGLADLKKLIEARLDSPTKSEKIKFDYKPAWLKAFSNIVPENNLKYEEGIVLLLALIPHMRPCFIDDIIQTIYPNGGDLPHLGGIRGKSHRGFLPTGETAMYLLAGEDIDRRFQLQHLFSEEHWFIKKQVLELARNGKEEPVLSGQLLLEQDYVDKFTLGKISKPVFSSEFPAALISTKMEWEDLVLPTQTEKQIQEILIWLEHNKVLMEGMGMDRKLKPGYRSFFHGPPGTGKTLTASLLGKYTRRDVYRIDLSTIVSKYIGETEKNLANLFNRAENKEWILFFDEADALFGKRTSVQNAHDRYANQEVAYLLQRVEEYAGLIVLASNFKSNIDDAFIRRFQSIIYFPLPKTNERLKLWQQSFPEKIKFSDEVDLKQIAQKFELSGGEIINIVQHICLFALSKNTTIITNKDIVEGIKREYTKSGKIF